MVVERLGKPLSLMNGPLIKREQESSQNYFQKKVLTFPKPVALLEYFISFVVNRKQSKDGLFLDFFAGSGSFGHAVMAQNAVDGGNRRYILIQLPGPLDPTNKDQKIASDFCDNLGKPRTLAELTKERLRRAANKIKRIIPRSLATRLPGFQTRHLQHSHREPDRDNWKQRA